jgi:hypothetical protein
MRQASPLLSHSETEIAGPCTTLPLRPNSGFLLGCEHEHPTVISAAACMSSAGSYVVAVENGKLRERNDAEEREFQHAVHGGVVERALKGITVTVSIKWSLS